LCALRWEIGHTAYFYEYRILRQHLGLEPILASVDSLYDSITIAHDDRWDLPLPSLDDTLAYMLAVHDRVRRYVEQDGPDPRRDYLLEYAIYHEDMHTEAFIYATGFRREARRQPFFRPPGDRCVLMAAELLTHQHSPTRGRQKGES
jgi:hypothetical protein